jgi:hypothetical protein
MRSHCPNAHNDLRERFDHTKYLQNQACGSISRDLSQFYVKRNFVYQTVKCYIETGSSGRREYTTRKQFVTNRVVVKKIRERNMQKCDISTRKLAADLKLNSKTVRLVLQNDLQLSAYKKKKSWLTSATVEKRFKPAEILPLTMVKMAKTQVSHSCSHI